MKFSLIFCLLVSFSAFAQSWSSIKEKQGEIEISLDYLIRNESSNCYKCPNNTYADPFYFNVSGAGLKGKTEVRVILTDKIYSSYNTSYPSNKISYSLDLVPMPEGHFSGAFGQSKKMLRNMLLELADYEKKLEVFESGHTGTFYHAQEIAVVVDGKWLKNFTVSLKDGIKY